MATQYLREIRAFQPEGPYYLGGFCMGGQVAYHMANLLAAEKQQVNLLALFDTYNHNGIPQTPSLRQRLQKARFHWRNITALNHQERSIYLREKIREVRTREWERFSVALRNLLSLGRGEMQGRVFLERINDQAGFAYRPRPYPGRITLFMPQRNYAFVTDPGMGWGPMATGGLNVVELPINPGAMFNEPFVQLLAEKLRACLDAVE
jgi:aspartate racemase